MDDRAEKLVEFLKEIEKFKTVERKLWTSNLARMESERKSKGKVEGFRHSLK